MFSFNIEELLFLWEFVLFESKFFFFKGVFFEVFFFVEMDFFVFE